MIGDQQSATLGLQVAEKNIKITYGTGCFLMKNTGPQFEVKNGLISTVILQLGENESPEYGLEAAVESGAGILNYFQNDLKLFDDFETEDNNILNKIQNKSGFFFENSNLNHTKTNETNSKNDIYLNETLFVPTLNSTLFSPFWESNIQGQISNLNFSTGRTELYAANLESFCFRIKQCLDAIDLNETSEIILDGGVSQNQYLVHYQANLLNKNLKRLSGLDGTMRGVFLGCLAYFNRKQFLKVRGGILNGNIIKHFSIGI